MEAVEGGRMEATRGIMLVSSVCSTVHSLSHSPMGKGCTQQQVRYLTRNHAVLDAVNGIELNSSAQGLPSPKPLGYAHGRKETCRVEHMMRRLLPRYSVLRYMHTVEHSIATRSCDRSARPGDNHPGRLRALCSDWQHAPNRSPGGAQRVIRRANWRGCRTSGPGLHFFSCGHVAAGWAAGCPGTK